MNLQAKNPAIKRLLSEVKEMEREKHREYYAKPLEVDRLDTYQADNLFEWHFTIRGPDGTEFEGGRFHGRILLPPEYPFKPPSILFLTPNGRFEIGKKICLSITGFHPEYWRPAWGIRTALLAIISFFPSKAEGAIGGLDWSTEERKSLAKKSFNWKCNVCGCDNSTAIDDSATANVSTSKENLSLFKPSFDNENRAAESQLKQRKLTTFEEYPESTRISPIATEPQNRISLVSTRRRIVNSLMIIILIVLVPLILRRFLMIFAVFRF